MIIAFTSDLHVDVTPPNAELIDYLIEQLHVIGPDVFIIAGDIAADLESYAKTLGRFSSLACHKLVVAGNHDIWIESKSKLHKGLDSTRKYYEYLPKICSENGFNYLGLKPLIIDNIGFVGTIGWYDYSFRDTSLDDSISMTTYSTGEYGFSRWMDKQYAWWLRNRDKKTYRLEHSRHCKSDASVTEEMVQSLQKQLAEIPAGGVTRIIAVLHHLPFREMVKYTGDPGWNFFSAFMGSQRFGQILGEDKRVSHVLCGHTHAKVDVTVGQIRALCSPVGYATEWRSDDLEAIAHDRLRIFEPE